MEPCEQPSPVAARSECLGRDEQCPLCGGDNRCRMAKGELLKGPCWCYEVAVPGNIVKRLATDQIEFACLCRPCLEIVARLSREFDDPDEVIAKIHKAVIALHPAASAVDA